MTLNCLPEELLLEIASLLKDDVARHPFDETYPSTRPGLSDIFHFGLSCRRTWRVVQDVIWKDHATETALYDLCLSCGIAEPSPSSLRQSVYLSTGARTPRILDYTSLVRHIEFIGDPPSMFSKTERVTATLLGMSVCFDTATLFPQLRSLSVVVNSLSMLTHLPYLIGPQLMDLSVVLEQRYWGLHEDRICLSLESFVEALSTAVALRSFKLIVNGLSAGWGLDESLIWTSSVKNTLTSYLQRLRNLATLKLVVPWNSSMLVPSLAQGLYLDKIFLRLGDDALPSLCTCIDQPVFPVLRSLRLVATSYVFAMDTWLESLATPSLTDLSISGVGMLPDRLEGVCRVIATRWSTTFSSLSTTIVCDKEPSSDTYDPIAASMTSLMRCSKLRGLQLSLTGKFPFGDTDYEMMANAWPNLQVLELKDFITYPTTPIPSAVSLLHLVERCPDLRSLWASVDFNMSKPIPSSSVQNIKHFQPLTSLHLGNSTCEDPEAAASFILRAFPALKTYWVGGGFGFIEVEQILRSRLARRGGSSP